jgi:hypothetical protein
MKAGLILVFLASICALSSIVDAGTIKLCVKMADNPIPGALVECFDDDLNNDDFMTQGTTNSQGCVTLTYQTKITSIWNCGNRWDGCILSNPDIYCEVSAECIAPKKTAIKTNHDQDTVANFGTVTVRANQAFCGDMSWGGCGPSSLFPPWLMDIADSVSGFEDSCNIHDVCYGRCNNARSKCDSDFKRNMYAQCKGESTCQMLADVFYTAVDKGGLSFCRDGRKKCTAAQRKKCSQ